MLSNQIVFSMVILFDFYFSKQWSGLLREAFTDSDIFGISFPMDLDVRMKAVLLAACFLIDFMYFEKTQNSEADRPGMLD